MSNTLIPKELIELLLHHKQANSHFTFLIGAGLSAESGIPTFRGDDGYWTIGSKNYHPQEIATRYMFNKHPREVWTWYLDRINGCMDAKPNSGHYALVHFENLLKNNFSLISQNVDGLNLRAGSSFDNFYPIHGDLTFMRCHFECSRTLYEIPKEIKGIKAEHVNPKSLDCPKCGRLCRPHVLWFDESYDEEFYKLYSVLSISQKTDVLITVGTTGTTNLPNQIFEQALLNNALVVDVNPNENDFGNQLKSYDKGYTLRENSGIVLPLLYQATK